MATLFTDLGIFAIVYFVLIFKVLFDLKIIYQNTKNKSLKIYIASILLSLMSLIFLTVFSNIFDNSLMIYSLLILFALGVIHEYKYSNSFI